MRNRLAVKKYTHKYWNLYYNKTTIEDCKRIADKMGLSYSEFVEGILVEFLEQNYDTSNPQKEAA